MRRESSSFPPLYRAMIAAGEGAGTLPLITERLAVLLERQAEMRGKLIGALAYPAILSLVNEIWDLLISFSITPRFEHILRDYNKVADFLSNSLCSQAEAQFKLEFDAPLRVGLASPDRKSFR